ncbi:MAG: glutamate dehydrogenase, partial [Candidatus Krumholzibacteria bacterium]|nr:glutamate dehydrogenase [Candidatus Krumholzibacteria bacterium]
EDTTASIQGFGNVAQYAIELYTRMGGTVVCVSSWDQEEQTTYAFHKVSGIDLEELKGITNRFGGIDKDKAKDLGYEVIPGDDWIDRDVDILLPAALEHQITDKNVGRISDRVKIIAEGANGPTTPEADAIIQERGIFMIPDFLANAGGVTCSYFEQVQCNMNYFWERDDVVSRLDKKMTSAYHSISDLAGKQKMYMRDAAYVVAINKVASACRDRGWV